MEVEALQEHLRNPAVMQEVLAGFRGHCSVGISRDAARQAVILVRVEGALRHEFPRHVKLDDVPVSVAVRYAYQAPKPLSASVESSPRSPG